MGKITKHKQDFNFEGLSLDADEFLKRIKENPWAIVDNNKVQLAIIFLREICIQNNNEESEKAKRLLEKAGLKAFIPKRVQSRRTDSPGLLDVKLHAPDFYRAIIQLEQKISPYIKERYHSYIDKRKDLKIAYRSIYNEELTEEDIRELTEGEKSRDRTSMALSIFAHRNQLSYNQVRDLYYDIRRAIVKGKEFYEPLSYPKYTPPPLNLRKQEEL
ncbi:MAG TPA: hypothetical protein VHT73_18770 [Thermodesulfobacteriota bacterium]|nr:hypothetical protein [Thermodesulfobacteriota bacterium]